jgi:hypothetical protein
MPQRGDIVVERLTGRRAIVIDVVSAEEVSCRFGNGRLEGRFTFEFEPPLSPFGSLLSFFFSSFVSRFRQSPPTSITGPPRPTLVRASPA